MDILTVQDDARTAAPDPEILDRATELGRVLFTQDEDLLAEAAQHQRTGAFFGGVIFAHQQRVSVANCVEFLKLIALAGEPDEFAD